MRLIRIATSLLPLAVCACGSGSGGDDAPGGDATGVWDASPADAAATSFRAASNDYIEAYCNSEYVCGGGDLRACQQKIASQMDKAAEALDADGEKACAACLETTAKEFNDMVAAGCALVIEWNKIYAVCDLDPDVDWDLDGKLTDRDQACAGFPYPYDAGP